MLLMQMQQDSYRNAKDVEVMEWEGRSPELGSKGDLSCGFPLYFFFSFLFCGFGFLKR